MSWPDKKTRKLDYGERCHILILPPAEDGLHRKVEVLFEGKDRGKQNLPHKIRIDGFTERLRPLPFNSLKAAPAKK